MKRTRQRPDPPRGELTREEYAVLSSCPQFDTCDAPKCPLDALYDVRVYLRGEKRCRARKATRIALGAGLPNHGLFAREIRGIELYYGSWERYLERKHDRVNKGVSS